MSLEIIARTGSYADFLKAYRKRARVFRRRAARKLYGGSSLVMWALGNNSMEDRYAMVDFLLEQGAVPGPPNPYGDGQLHVLFSRVDWDSACDARIAERLIEMGADINLRNDKGMVPLKELLLRKGTRAEMAPSTGRSCWPPTWTPPRRTRVATTWWRPPASCEEVSPSNG